MRKLKKQLSMIIYLILTICVGGIVYNSVTGISYYSDQSQKFYYSLSIVGILILLLLVRQLISMRQSMLEEKKKGIINSEFDLMINLLYRNHRATATSREGFQKEVIHFVKEIDKFMLTDIHQTYLNSLLEASQDIAVIESLQQRTGGRKRKSDRYKRAQLKVSPEHLASQNHLVELGIFELNNKKLLTNFAENEGFKVMVNQLVKRYHSDYQELLNFFDSLTILLKFLNSNVINNRLTADEYQQYISIIRNLISRDDLLLVLVYALVIPEGCSLAIELVGSSFFGAHADILQKRFVDYPELFTQQVVLFTCPDTLKKSLKKQELMRYYYEAILKEIEAEKVTKLDLIYQVLDKKGDYFREHKGFNYLQLIETMTVAD